MTEAESQYFDMMEQLFTHPAWRIFKDDITGWVAAIETKWRTIKPEALAFEQGRIAALEQVLEHFKLCESLKAQALDRDASEGEDPHVV